MARQAVKQQFRGMRNGAGNNQPDLEDEKRFSGLRRRLGEEGYGESLGYESLPLVERLMDDLMSLRQTHNTLASRFEELSANEARLQRSIHPTQKELGRMVKENNQLHLELIEHGEQAEASQRRTELEMKKLKTALADQGFVVSQQSQHIRDLERQIESHKARITDLLDSNFTCTVGPYGDVKPKGQQIMMTHTASPAVQLPESDLGDQVMVDLEAETTKQIVILTRNLQDSREEHAELAVKVSFLENVVRNRENEIARMGKLMTNNVNSDMEDLEKARDQQEVLIKRLNDQLDIVSAQLAEADATRMELDDLKEECAAAKTLAASLQDELAESRQISGDLQRLLERQGESAVKAPGGDVDVEELQQRLEQVDDDMYRLQDKLDESESDNKALNAQILQLRRALEKTETERSSEITRLSNEMTRLMQELDRLGQREEEGRKLKEELLKYREEVETLSQGRRQQVEYIQEVQSVRRHVAVVEEEKESLKCELRDALQACDAKDEAIAEERKAKDQLAEVIMGFEAQMENVQKNIRGLATDWDEKERQYATAFVDLKRTQEDASRSTVPATEVITLGQRLKDTERTVMELKQRMADAQEGEKMARRRADEAEERLKGLREKLAASEESMRSIRRQQESSSDQAGRRQRDLEERAEAAEDKCAERERAIGELQALLASMDGTRGEVESQLKAFMSQDDGLKKRIAHLEAEVTRLQGDVRRREDDRERAIAAVSAVDKERDTVLARLEERAEAVRVLEVRLREEQQLREQRESSGMVAQQQADMFRQANSDCEMQLQSLRRQLSQDLDHRRDLEALCMAREEEIRNLTADLLSMTRENQVVNSELADMLSQRDSLKADLDAALDRLAVAEQLLQGKESERDEVLMSYRALNEERSRIELNYERVMTECHEMKGHVYAREEELQRSSDTIRALEQENHRLSLDLQNVQRHNKALADRIVVLEGQLKTYGAEASAHRQEQQASSGALAMLERSKQESVRENALLRDEIVALRGKVSNLSSEKDLFNAKLDAERTRSKDLEDVLQAIRAKEHAATLSEQERASQNASLLDQLHRAHAERDRLTEEVRMHTSRREEIEYELTKVKRSVVADSAQHQALSSEISGLRSKIQDLQGIVEQQTAALELKERESAKLRQRLSKMQADADVNERKVIDLESKVRRHDETVSTLQLAARQHTTALSGHETENERLRATLRTTEQELDRSRSEVRSVKDEVHSLHTRLSILQTELNDVTADRDKIRAQLDQANTQVANARQDAQETSELLEKLDGDYRMMQSKYLSLLEDQRGSVRGVGSRAGSHMGSPPRASRGGSHMGSPPR